MGYMHIDRKRKIFCYQLLKRGVPHSVIQYRVREQFGHQHGEIASSTLSKIKRAGDLTGDPTYVSKIIRPGHTLTYAHKKLILAELLALCTASTDELEAKLRVAETTARTVFAHETINTAIRAASWTRKRTTIYNARRCPYESARVRQALKAYDMCQVLYLDASHIADDVSHVNL